MKENTSSPPIIRDENITNMDGYRSLERMRGKPGKLDLTNMYPKNAPIGEDRDEEQDTPVDNPAISENSEK